MKLGSQKKYVLIPESDFIIYKSLLQILNEKRGKRNSTVSRSELVKTGGFSHKLLSKKILNSYLLNGDQNKCQK